MEAEAKLKYLRMSPKKVALVADSLRGKRAMEAEKILKVMPKKAAHYLLKLLMSAVANAQVKDSVKKEDLVVKEIRVDGGPVLKRGQPVSRGVWHPILKRTSHISIKLVEVKVQEGKQK